MNLLVSVIICTKDRENLLLESIESVIAQNFLNWELVIVDDGSQVNMVQVVEALLGELNLPFIGIRHEASKGIASARNAGVKASRGSWIYFLDDDDLLITSALGNLVDAVVEYKLDCLFHGIKPFGRDAKVKAVELKLANERVLKSASYTQPVSNIYLFNQDLYLSLLVTVPVAFQKCLFSRELWDMTQGMREASLMPEPEWSIKASLLGKCGLIVEPLYRWRVEGQNFFSLKADEYKIQGRVVDNFLALLEFVSNNKNINSLQTKNIKNALGRAWCNLAWCELYQNNRLSCLRALMESALINPEFRQFKILVKMILPIDYLSRTSK